MLKKVLDKLPYIALAASCVFVFAVFFVFETANTSGTSMEPTLHGGNQEHILRTPFADIERFDIVSVNMTDNIKDAIAKYGVNKEDHDGIIKRVVGMPGDHVTSDGVHVYINGELLDEPYADFGDPNISLGIKVRDIILGEDEYFICGDNRMYSGDSRTFGAVKHDDIFGKLYFGNPVEAFLENVLN